MKYIWKISYFMDRTRQDKTNVLRNVSLWSEIILVISNRTRAARSFDFEITRMILDQIPLHSVQLPLLIL